MGNVFQSSWTDILQSTTTRLCERSVEILTIMWTSWFLLYYFWFMYFEDLLLCAYNFRSFFLIDHISLHNVPLYSPVPFLKSILLGIICLLQLFCAKCLHGIVFFILLLLSYPYRYTWSGFHQIPSLVLCSCVYKEYFCKTYYKNLLFVCLL